MNLPESLQVGLSTFFSYAELVAAIVNPAHSPRFEHESEPHRRYQGAIYRYHGYS